MGIAVGDPHRTEYELPRQTLKTFFSRLPTNNDQLHLLVPAGVGDNLWIIAKHWKTAMERDVTFWLPGDEQRRSGDVYRMMGLQHGYMPGLTTEWIWSQPGQPPIPDTGAVLSIQPNRHLEHGHRIEKWYPDLEFRNPIEFIDNTRVAVNVATGASKYVVVFTSQLQYMEYGGNLKPAQWARIFRQIEKDVAPVVLIAAGKDVEFAEEVARYFPPIIPPVLNAPLDAIYTLMQNAEMVVGAHAGPLIMSTYMGIPTLHAYPRWLAPMPGTWEHEGSVWGACFLDELENVVRDGIRFTGNADMGRMRSEQSVKLRMTLGSDKWKPQSDVSLATLPEPPHSFTVEDAMEGASCG